MCRSLIVFCFFFQAEDGIRDGHVTGVQTCALPICGLALQPHAYSPPLAEHAGAYDQRGKPRSEERRVGKECRSRGAPDQEKKKKAARREEGRRGERKG